MLSWRRFESLYSHLPHPTPPRVSQEAQNPLSLHELTACIYYKLALDRGLRGCDPEADHCMHRQEGTEADSHVSDSELDEAIR